MNYFEQNLENEYYENDLNYDVNINDFLIISVDLSIELSTINI